MPPWRWQNQCWMAKSDSAAGLRQRRHRPRPLAQSLGRRLSPAGREAVDGQLSTAIGRYPEGVRQGDAVSRRT